jgi:D-amino-acid oxidase
MHKCFKIKVTNQLVVVLAIIMAFSSFSMETETRHVSPPNLSDDHLGSQIICHRPMRSKTPNWAVEKDIENDKIIVHHYGHGGSGWTMAPASAEYVITLLERSAYSSDLDKKTHITVVGAGVIGLFTAYSLQQHGYENITVVADKFDNLTSHNAGGLIAPVCMDNESSQQKIIDKISIDSYKFFASIAHKKHRHFKTGASIVPTYFENVDDSQLGPYVRKKIMQPPKNVILDFGNGTQRKMMAYDDGIFIDTTEMMKSLTDYLQAYAKFERRRINSFCEIDSKYIINCTGMGSINLVPKDENLISVQGHLVMLKDQSSHLPYMISTYTNGQHVNRHGQKVQRSFYIMPKPVIGGTFIAGATADTPNEEEFAILIDNARKFFGLIK